jgi:hypothetical protein
MRLLTLGFVAAVCAVGTGIAQTTAAQFVASARTALGGDAALQAITSLSFNGTTTRSIGPDNVRESVDVSVVWPDKFLRVERRLADRGPLGSFQITKYEGFNADVPINAVEAPGAPFPVVIPARPGRLTPGEIAAARGRQLNAAHHLYVQLVMPLFAAASAGYPLSLTSLGQQPLPSGSADVIEMKGPDGFTFQLWLDAATHRPVRLTWKAMPVVTTSTSMTFTTRPGQPPPPQRIELPRDPTEGMAPVEWEVTFTDYKTEGGLTWPRRFTTSFDGQKWEELRVNRFRINPKIDPKTFNPRK